MRHEVSCIDLFCGAGGLTHGFVLEGVPVRAGIDIDPVCRVPYEENNDAGFVNKSVRDVSAGELIERYGDTDIKILAGCAPCQPFSTYVQRYGDTDRDSKGTLIGDFARLVEGVQPDVVCMENVPAVGAKSVFKSFVKGLQDGGYSVWHRVIDCSQYGVPQSRRRMVLLASRRGHIELVPPLGGPPKTVRQTIGALPPVEAGADAHGDRLHVAASLSAKNSERIKASIPGGTWRDWPPGLMAGCHRADTGKTFSSVYGRMEWDKPAPTLTTQCYGFGNGRFGHPEQNRAITLREAAMLQGFPHTYKFAADNDPVRFTVLGRLIGNAVPVELGRAIARSIKAHLRTL